MDHELLDRHLLTVAVDVLNTPYPYVSGHVATGPDDTDITPQRLHPSFHGALDWHSSVHMQWSLVQLLGRRPEVPGAASGREAQAARELLDARLTVEHLAVEAAYLRERPAFERPYGWAWAAMLGAAVRGEPAWSAAMAPLLDTIADHVLAWLPRQAYPIRHGKHQNDAFALLLLHSAYGELGREDVVAAVAARARDWFADDGPASTADEPSGSDFLSPALTEAALMQVVLAEDFVPWLEAFLPGLGEGAHQHLLEPPTVLDPTDGQCAHLLGLALSRAWQLRALATSLPGPRADILRQSADTQVAAVLPHVTDGDFMATHWLVSFLLLATTHQFL
ncbi:DUF2891 domain-containing protein [Ornithinimicrobium sp. F0845]|uniref:DUF2891 family protein n=1 Tax=Ornithinimicrobium sp. F0845 TaxID=2926412 RepID=UPI001FF643E3|nr:DUF2891 family protein [Ornithinimicrobium sp. F0845]MCK0112754.1 DUF2891 domain-containing protein [Ornithinimicrobium sp. F0845]